MASRAEALGWRRAWLPVAAVVVLVMGTHSLDMIATLAAQGPSPIPNGRLVSGTLSFDGKATAGDFTGTTNSVTGQLTGAPDLSAVHGWVEAPVESLKTGDRRRDKDLNKSMESSRYPALRFELSRIAQKPPAGDSILVTLLGTLILHGVSRRVELPATIDFRGTTARVRSDFPLNLKDYRIGGLSKMLGLLKMHENIEVHVNLAFQLASTGSQ
jgi:polyisoprenoid-binding protein YceI